jgi:16S rRNA (guanine527-N7)-methyltransferase
MELVELSRTSFEAELVAAGVATLSATALDALFLHYEELRRWAPRVDLIGPGAVPELFERHYAESLAALPWLPERPLRLLDAGSGAGFPGVVLSAARPDAEVWLVEPRERRAAFLSAVVRKASLGARVVAARVERNSIDVLPQRVDVVTLRALRLDSPLVRALTRCLAPAATILVWSGGEAPQLPSEFEVGRSLLLPGSRQRHLREYRWLGGVG